MRLARFAALALTLLAAFSAPSTAQTPAAAPQRLDPVVKDLVFGTDWYGLYIRGSKIGWMRTETARSGDAGARRVISKMGMELKITTLGRQGITRTSSELEFEAEAPFRLMSLKSSSINDDVKQRITLKRQAEGFEALVETGGNTQQRRIDTLDYTLGDEKAVDIWLMRKPASGDTIAVRNLDAESLELDTITHTLVATRPTRIAGVDLVMHEVKSFFPRSQMTVVAKIDQSMRTIHVDMLGFLEGRLETEEQAKNTTFSADLFALSTAKSDRQLGPHARIAAITLEVEAQGLEPWIKSGPNQLVEATPGGKLRIKLGPKATPAVKATPKEIAASIGETIALPIRDAKVKALAAVAVGDATTAAERLERIVAFVSSYVTPSLDPAPPKLLDLLERKSGDCKAYAMLVIALARAAGLPAREISGLVYLGDAEQAFGGHAWAEVVVDGVWVPVDASIPLTRLGGGHIRFGDGEAGLSAFSALMAAGGISVRVLDIDAAR